MWRLGLIYGLGFGYRVWNLMLEFRVWSLGFRICALGLMVNGLRVGFKLVAISILYGPYPVLV